MMPADPDDFSLIHGGAVDRLSLRIGLLRSPLDPRRNRQIGAAILLTWLPLLVISALEGRAFGGARLSFLKDLDAHARFLVALPLLILAEPIVEERLRPALALFVEKGIVRPEDRTRFDAIVSSTKRWRNSGVLELGLLALVFTGGHVIWSEGLAVDGPTWFVRSIDGRPALSRAGLWYAWISVPIFQFILLRWWYRVVLWCRFLFFVSRLDLHLSPAHPDRAGGLGFLGTSTLAFGPLLVGQSVLVSAMTASKILQQGAQLESFKLELGGAVVFLLLQALGPLLVFAPRLLEAKRRGLHDYGLLADRYVKAFERKWCPAADVPDQPFLGTADIQSLADLDGSFSVVREMRAFPFGKETIIPLVAMIMLPGIPLVSAVIPLEDLAKRLLVALL